ncbi:MAG: PEP/pyruvate-binding domain-containing protein [Rhizomicrobium sp.]
MTLVRPFDAIGLGDRLSVGGKGANLGELARAGIPLPPGFVVTTAAFEQFLTATDGDGAIRRAIGALAADDIAAIGEASAAIRARIEGAPLPADIADAIAAAHAALCGGEARLPLAVRSSATSEDGEDASFAGLQDTYLWLRGLDQVREHVRRCWASLYSVESLNYRLRLKLREEALAMGVVVQRMVDSRCSGVMFTRSPTTGDRSVIAIEGSYGLGSAIVGGEVTPDKYIVNKVTGEIAGRMIAHKTVQHIPDFEAGGVVPAAVAAAECALPCLADAEIAALAQIGRRVERHYGRPQDIEWAIARGPQAEIFLLQSRPETVWSKRDAQPVAAPKAAAVDHVFAAFSRNR